MRSFAPLALVLLFYSGGAQSTFQLAPPMLRYNTVFLSGPVQLEMIFNQPGAAIHYTLNGVEPTLADPVYTVPFTIDKRTIVKARAMGDGFFPSETAGAEFITAGKPVREISFTPPHESHATGKADILFDNMGGFPNYGNGNWLGYNIDTIEINIVLKQEETIAAVLLDLLEDENSWIFLPAQVQLSYYDKNRHQWIQAGQKEWPSAKPGPKQALPAEITLQQKIKADRLKVVLLTVKKIPDWHAGKGSHGWLFIDEIKVY